ncbi:MAG: glycosyltransferase [Bacteroidota bacterium]
MDLIFISMSSWDNDISSAALSLAKEFSKHHRVFYFDNPFTIKDFIADFQQPKIRTRLKRFFAAKHRYQHLPNLGINFYAITPSLTLPINFLPKGSRLYRFFLRKNRRIIQKNLQSLLQHYNVHHYIFFNSFNPFYHAILPKDQLPAFTVYQSRDDISQITYGAKHGVQLEKEAIQESDIAFATSKELARKLQSSTQSSVHHLPNAVDLDSFPYPLPKNRKPPEIASIKEPIICFVGNLDQRVDYPLLYQIAQNHPDKRLLIIGPRNDQDYHQLDFSSLPNILFIGPKPHHQLHHYLQFVSCTIIPFVRTTLTASIYPLKINEYLAMGKPVVTTDFSEDVLSFKDICHISSDHASFSQLITHAVAQTDDNELVQQRVSFAKQNSWESRVASFWEAVKPSLNHS